MKVENLEVGMVIKNYKELCKVLDVKVKNGGKSKIRQLEWFEEHFKFCKQGHKFIIEDITRESVVPIVDKRGGSYNTVEYIPSIEKLILDLLVQEENDGKVFLSKNQLLTALSMINENYAYCRRRTLKLSKFMDVDELNIKEWYDSTSGLLERNLTQALDSLVNQSLIMYTQEITICKIKPNNEKICVDRVVKIDRYGEEKEHYKVNNTLRKEYREANEQEKRDIMKIERNFLEEYGCNNKQEVIRKGLWVDFTESVKDEIFKKHNIAFYYKSYKILCNYEHIYKKWKKINELSLNERDRETEQLLLNRNIIERNKTNTENKHNRAIKEQEVLSNGFGTVVDLGSKVRRAKSNYLIEMDKLNETLINKDVASIGKEVNRLRIM